MIERKIESLIHQAISELEYSDCYVVEMKVHNNKIEIFLDSDDSITYLKCRKISRFIEAVLDEEQWLGEKYTLDVSSAGIGRPLKLARQYAKNIDRDIEVKTIDGQKIRGILTAVSEEGISVTFEETIKQGKKKKKIDTTVDVLRSDIIESKIKVSFKRRK